MKHTLLRHRSDRKKLRDSIGSIHFDILKIKRGNNLQCDICGKKTNGIGRFHILPVGLYPKLEYVDNNILIACWFPCHNNWHHNYYSGKEIEKKIVELLGPEYREKLLIRNKLMPQHTELYLKCLLMTMQKELEALKAMV